MSRPSLTPYIRQVQERPIPRWTGRITRVVGNLVESEGPFCSVGECCEMVDRTGQVYTGEVVGFSGKNVLSMPLERPGGIGYGDCISTRGERPTVRVGDQVLGRVLDGTGKPLDSRPPYQATERWPLYAAPHLPLERAPITEALGCGIRAIDGFITCARGQRLGIFGGSGVGKSTLIGMMARGSAADLAVLALVGERGREVRDYLEKAIGKQGLENSVVVVSTSDQSPLLRIRAALAASAIAEYFCSKGKHVLLVMDSLTRVAMAQREIGLAAGEPPTSRGYTPSVFTLLARLIERAGHFGKGSITAFYTVLMEGDDQQDVIVDAVRALLDGHIVLDRRLGNQGHYPAISVLDSLSRLMPAVTGREAMEKATRLRRLLATYTASEDMIRVGAYQKGADPLLDQAIAAMPAITGFLRQRSDEAAPFAQTMASLQTLPG